MIKATVKEEEDEEDDADDDDDDDDDRGKGEEKSKQQQDKTMELMPLTNDGTSHGQHRRAKTPPAASEIRVGNSKKKKIETNIK